MNMSTTNEQSASPLMPILVEVDELDPLYSGPKIEGGTITLEFVNSMIHHFTNKERLPNKFVFEILLQTKDLLCKLPSLVDITLPADGQQITVCGDIHGQFFDLIKIFEINGFPSDENPYLFNGDFVDRGSYSLEVVLTLFAFKCLYPNSMFLTRGNHESRNLNEYYGFESEVILKLNETFVDLFAQVFCCLPLAHVINNKVFVTHGGLFSDDGVKLSDIREIDRFREPPEDGLMCELLWSDPKPGLGRRPSIRGLGVAFGSDVTKKFLDENGLSLVVRSHEVKQEGFEFEHDDRLVTVFSAPNYCGQFGNYGAFLRFEAPSMKYEPTQFSAAPHDPHPEVTPMICENYRCDESLDLDIIMV